MVSNGLMEDCYCFAEGSDGEVFTTPQETPEASLDCNVGQGY